MCCEMRVSLSRDKTSLGEAHGSSGQQWAWGWVVVGVVNARTQRVTRLPLEPDRRRRPPAAREHAPNKQLQIREPHRYPDVVRGVLEQR